MDLEEHNLTCTADVQPSRPALNWTQALQAKTQALQAKRKQSSGLSGGDSKRRLTENGVGSGSEDTTAHHGSSRQSMPTSTSAEPTSSAKPGFIPIKRQPLSVSSSDDNGMLDDDSTDSDSDSEPDAPVQLDSGNADPPPRPLKVLPSVSENQGLPLQTHTNGTCLVSCMGDPKMSLQLPTTATVCIANGRGRIPRWKRHAARFCPLDTRCTPIPSIHSSAPIACVASSSGRFRGSESTSG